ncbi:MAG: hypothetical protein MJE68_32890 [Proteobacteria bacterium]|nr:hypothetical protein [Pseudomonadota bacterium]
MALVAKQGNFKEFIFNILIFSIIEWKYFSKRKMREGTRRERKTKSRISLRTLSHLKAIITPLRGESHVPPMKLGWSGGRECDRDHSHKKSCTPIHDWVKNEAQ